MKVNDVEKAKAAAAVLLRKAASPSRGASTRRWKSPTSVSAT